MKKLILTSLLILFVVSIQAQLKLNQSNFNSKLKGYIIKNDNTKKEGSIWYLHPLKMMDEVVFNGNTYKPGEIKGFFVDGNFWISRKFKKKEKFLAISHTGEITVFHHFTLKEGESSNITSSTEYNISDHMMKLDEEPVQLATYILGFKKKMSAFVSDYPEMARKIAKKEKGYGILYFDKIVDEYNEWYAENNPVEKVEAVEEVAEVEEVVAVEKVTEVKEAVSVREKETGEETTGIGFPVKLLGIWQKGNVTLTISEDKIIRNESGDVSRYYEGKITEYDKEKAFIAAKLYKVTSEGYDHSESYKNEYYILYVGTIGSETVELSTPSGSGAISGDYIHAYHDETSRLWHNYTRVK